MLTTSLVNYFRACIPIVNIESHSLEEESLLLDLIKEVADHPKLKLPIFSWSQTEGLSELFYDDQGIVKQKTGFTPQSDPILDMLNYIDSYKGKGIFVLLDLHFYLGSDPTRTDLLAIRKIKDLSFSLKRSYKRIILLGQNCHLSEEFSGLIQLCENPLPSWQEINNYVEKTLLELKESKIEIALTEEEKTIISNSGLGLSLSQIGDGLRLSAIANGEININTSILLTEIKIKEFKTKNLEFCPTPDVDVGGLDLLKDWIKKRAKLFNQISNNSLLPIPKGLLLVGVPGTGKSLVAKAIGSMLNVPILKLDMGNIYNSLVGESEGNLRRMLKYAEAIAPCVLFIDELEKTLTPNSTGDSGVSSRLFGTFLSWLSDKTAPVFVVATANSIAYLPPELTRKGRFDEIFFLDLPNEQERQEILKAHLKIRDITCSQEEIEEIVIACRDFSGAEIKDVVENAIIEAFYEDRTEVTYADLKKAISNISLSFSRGETIEQLRTWARGAARNASSPEKASKTIKIFN